MSPRSLRYRASLWPIKIGLVCRCCAWRSTILTYVIPYWRAFNPCPPPSVLFLVPFGYPQVPLQGCSGPERHRRSHVRVPPRAVCWLRAIENEEGRKLYLVLHDLLHRRLRPELVRRYVVHVFFSVRLLEPLFVFVTSSKEERGWKCTATIG